MSQKIGFAAEDQALQYLTTHGLRWVASNYRTRCGEIDLIMRDGHCLVFIEVRARASNAFGGALASVTHSKRQKLIKTALFYLSAHKLKDQAVRFDVLSMEGVPPRVEWIKNAFGTDF